jgi:hypothetical protein
LTVDGTFLLNTTFSPGVTTTSIVATFSSSYGSACYFDYWVLGVGSGSTKMRSGIIIVVWDQSGNITWTDIASPDLLSSTNGIKFSLSINSGIVELTANIAVDTWDVKTGVRII